MYGKVVQNDEKFFLGQPPFHLTPPLWGWGVPWPGGAFFRLETQKFGFPIPKLVEICIFPAAPRTQSPKNCMCLFVPPIGLNYYKVTFLPLGVDILHTNVWPTMANFFRTIHFWYWSPPPNPPFGSPHTIFFENSHFSIQKPTSSHILAFIYALNDISQLQIISYMYLMQLFHSWNSY